MDFEKIKKDLSEIYLKNADVKPITELFCKAINNAMEQAFSLGFKCGKTEYFQWHNLQKNNKDLPDTPRQVLIMYEGGDYDIGEYWNGGEGWGDLPCDVVMWKEIS